jgi:hypothetical protein
VSCRVDALASAAARVIAAASETRKRDDAPDGLDDTDGPGAAQKATATRQSAPKRDEDAQKLVLGPTVRLLGGCNRARGQVIRQPLPDPYEDDGRPIPAMTLEEIAGAIGDTYSAKRRGESTRMTAT